MLPRLAQAVRAAASRLGSRWPISGSVEWQVARIFDETGVPIADRITRATELVVGCRASSIPKPNVSDLAARNLHRLVLELTDNTGSIRWPELSLFRLIRPNYSDTKALRVRDFARVFREELRTRPADAKTMLRQFRDARNEVSLIRQARASNGGMTGLNRTTFLSPEVDWGNLFSRLPWALTVAHEMDHVATMGGAYGRFASWLMHHRFRWWNRLLNPLTPVTNRLATYVDEGRSIGGSWEVLSRIPSAHRAELMYEVAADSASQPFLRSGNPHRVFREIERGIADELARRRARHAVISFQALRHSSLGRESFIRAMRPWCHYDLFGLATYVPRWEYRFYAQEGLLAGYYMAKIGYGVKLAGWAAGIHWLFSREPTEP